MKKHLAICVVTVFLGIVSAVLGQASQAGPAAKPAAARVNVTGTWSSNLPGSPDLKLFQDGDLVWGKDHLSEGGTRGLWSDGRLMLVYTDSVLIRTTRDAGREPCWC